MALVPRYKRSQECRSVTDSVGGGFFQFWPGSAGRVNEPGCWMNEERMPPGSELMSPVVGTSLFIIIAARFELQGTAS